MLIIYLSRPLGFDDSIVITNAPNNKCLEIIPLLRRICCGVSSGLKNIYPYDVPKWNTRKISLPISENVAIKLCFSVKVSRIPASIKK